MMARIVAGDCVEAMRALLAEGVEVQAIVTDPPYHLTSIVDRFGKTGSAPAQYGTDGVYARTSRGFMGKEWDGGDTAFRMETWRAAFDLLPPGGHLIAFGGTRTYHRMVCAIEDAGFEIRDQLAWVYATGFPKSLDVSKAIDKAAGAEREVIGRHPYAARKPNGTWTGEVYGDEPGHASGPSLTAPATDAARQWQGWGTALKPAWEPICLARKPLVGTVAQNVMAHGTGAINVDACRVGEGVFRSTGNAPRERGDGWGMQGGIIGGSPLGRWPANLCHDGSDEVEQAFAAFGESKPKAARTGIKGGENACFMSRGNGANATRVGHWPEDQGGTASRFFYSAKAGRFDRVVQCTGCGARAFGKQACGCPGGTKARSHPTTKPIDLMRWLVRMVPPPGGAVLDPFMGSGTTLAAALSEGFGAIGIDADPESVGDAEFRCAALPDDRKEPKPSPVKAARRKAAPDGNQLLLGFSEFLAKKVAAE